MPRPPDASPQTRLILDLLAAEPTDWSYGYDLSRRSGLKSGTLYPILARLAERGWLEDQLRELGFESYSPSAANFVFVKPALGNSAAAAADALRERKILVRHYDRDPIAGWFRITVGTRDQHERLLAAFKEILI